MYTQALIDQINAEEQIAKDKLEEAERLLKEAQDNVKDARTAYKVWIDEASVQYKWVSE